MYEEHSSQEIRQLDKRITNPGRRLCAYVIDGIIAVIPALILSLVISTIMLPYLLFITYPSPLVGASAYLGYSTYDNFKVTSSSEMQENGEKVVIEENRNYGGRPSPITSLMAVLGLIFYLFYSLICTLLYKGQTVGKKLMRIRIRASNTAMATTGAIFSRELLGKTLLNSIPLIPLISFFTILFTKEHKALHDMLADTTVSDV